MNAGEIAQQLVELIQDETRRLDNDGRRIVANRIYDLLDEWYAKVEPKCVVSSKPRPDPAEAPMSNAEAKAFESTFCPFRAFEGVPYGDCPTDYLERIADMSREIWRNIWRYLRNAEVKRKRGIE